MRIKIHKHNFEILGYPYTIKLAYTFSCSDSLSNIRSCLGSSLFSVIDLESTISSSAISGFLSVLTGAVVQCPKPLHKTYQINLLTEAS